MKPLVKILQYNNKNNENNCINNKDSDKNIRVYKNHKKIKFWKWCEKINKNLNINFKKFKNFLIFKIFLLLYYYFNNYYP